MGAPEICARCGTVHIRVIVEGEPLCEEHRAEWIAEEAQAANEDRIQRVMSALDRVFDEQSEDEWEDHLRHVAIVAITAADGASA